MLVVCYYIIQLSTEQLCDFLAYFLVTINNRFYRYSSERIADLIIKDAVVECKLQEELASVFCSIKSGKMVYPRDEMVILQIGRVCILIHELYMLQVYE